MRGSAEASSYTPYPTVDVPGAPPTDYQTERATPGAFGAQVGQALQSVGTDVLKVGEVYGTLAGEQAATNYQQEADKILHGDPDKPGDVGYYGLKGQAAMDARQGTVQALNALQQKYAGTLYTAHSQTIFHDQTRNLASRFTAEIGRHYDLQANDWAKTVNKDRFDNAVASAALRPEDEDYATQMLGQANSALMKQGQFDGALPKDPSKLTDDQAAHMTALQRHASTAITEARIKALLPTNPGAASRLLEQNRPALMAAGNYDALSNAVRVRGDAALGVEIYRGTGGGGASPQGGTRLPAGVGGAVATRISQEAEHQGVDNNLALTTAHIESSMGQNLGSRGNIFQLGGPEKASVGGMGADIDSQVRGGITFLKKKQTELSAALGRDPTPAEIYLAHQQGTGGAAALLTAAPGTPAGQVVPPQNISANGGDPNAPASQFVAHWRNEFQKTSAAYGGEATPTAGFDSAGGDSIAVGGIRHGGLKGTAADSVASGMGPVSDAAGGRNPQQGLDYLNANPDRFKNERVFWSSGLMNAGANPQAALPIVGAQLDALKARGATPVLVGVDTGKFAQYNTALAAIAEEKGVPFAGPLPTNNVHPGPQGYKQYAADAAKLLPTAPPPDQLVGQPPAPATPRAPGATPPVSPPPGMQDLANAHRAVAQRYADKLNQIAADPRSLSNPDAATHARDIAKDEFTKDRSVIAANMQYITETRNAAVTEYVKELRPDAAVPVDFYDRITADKRLDGASLENLYKLAEAHVKKSVAGDLIQYGAKFYDAYNRLTLEDTDQNRLRDPSQVIAMAQAKPDGTQDITLAGAGKLIQSMGELNKRDPILADKKKELMNLIMPMDRALEEYSLPQRTQRYGLNWDIDQQINQAERDKKNPYNLFNPASPDYLGKHYQEQIDANALKQKIEGDKTLQTEAGIVAAVRTNKITREQAAEALRRIGVPFVDPGATAAPAIAPPMGH